MVQLVYKELMLLGLISFMLFLIELWSCLSPAIAHNLHTIHLLLFLLSMAYILEAVFILCISEIVVRRWTKCERMSLLEHAKVKLKVAAIEDELALRGAFRRFFSWCLLYEHHNSQRIARCADARVFALPRPAPPASHLPHHTSHLLPLPPQVPRRPPPVHQIERAARDRLPVQPVPEGVRPPALRPADPHPLGDLGRRLRVDPDPPAAPNDVRQRVPQRWERRRERDAVDRGRRRPGGRAGPVDARLHAVLCGGADRVADRRLPEGGPRAGA